MKMILIIYFSPAFSLEEQKSQLLRALPGVVSSFVREIRGKNFLVHWPNVLGWIRNLVMEGIEPNPGPTFEELVEKIKIKTKDSFPAWTAPLDKLRAQIKASYSLGLSVTVADTIRFIDDATNNDYLTGLGLMKNERDIMKEAAKELEPPGNHLFLVSVFSIRATTPAFILLLRKPCRSRCVPDFVQYVASNSFYKGAAKSQLLRASFVRDFYTPLTHSELKRPREELPQKRTKFVADTGKLLRIHCSQFFFRLDAALLELGKAHAAPFW